MAEMIFIKRNFELKLTENLTLNQFEPPQVPTKEPFTPVSHGASMRISVTIVLPVSTGPVVPDRRCAA